MHKPQEASTISPVHISTEIIGRSLMKVVSVVRGGGRFGGYNNVLQDGRRLFGVVLVSLAFCQVTNFVIEEHFSDRECPRLDFIVNIANREIQELDLWIKT